MDVSQQRVNADKHGWPEFLNWRRVLLPAHEPSFGARPVPGRSGSDSLLVPEPSPSRRLHSDPLRAGTSRAPEAGGFGGARRDKSSGRPLLGERAGVRASVFSNPIFGAGGSRYFRFQISD